MAPSARTTERSILAAGAFALAASSFLPLLAVWKAPPCPGWTCYWPIPRRVPTPVTGTTLWDTRPSLAVLLVAAAALALVVGATVRAVVARRVAAWSVLLTVAVVVAETAHRSGTVSLHGRALVTSAWLAVPVWGGLVAALALALEPEAAQRGT